MIKINLAEKKQSSAIGQTKVGGLSGGLGSFSKFDIEELKGLPLGKVIFPIVICLVASYGLDFYKSKKVEDLEEVLAKLHGHNGKLQEEIAKYKAYDSLKKTLDEDESTIRTKLDIIKRLVSDRAFAYQLLVSISKSIPKDVWITILTVDKDGLSMSGQSLDFTQISDFMKNLNDNSLLSGVELKNTEQGVTKSNAEIASFELKAKRR